MLNTGLLQRLVVPTVSKVFVDIGTCDFDSSLPLADSGWHGYMIEADPKYADAMENKTSSYENVKVFNMAISDVDGSVPFITADPDENDPGNDWKRGMGHVTSESHAGNRMLEVEANHHFIGKRIFVKSCTLDTFISEQKITSVDFMKIDVEGHEMNIIKDYSWSVKPKLIKIEHSHSDKGAMQNILQENGYLIYTETSDIYGILK